MHVHATTRLCTHVHAHVRACTQARVRACMQACMRARMHMRAPPVPTGVYAHAHAYVAPPARADTAYTLMRVHM